MPRPYSRRSIRLRHYDYRSSGVYFITICAAKKAFIFGDVRDDGVWLSHAGRIVDACWREIPVHFPHVELDDFVVMPNHLHGILSLERATHASLLRNRGPRAGSVGAVVGSFKSAAAKKINAIHRTASGRVWQRNYVERVVRNDEELRAYRQYIADNPLRWALDRENPLCA